MSRSNPQRPTGRETTIGTNYYYHEKPACGECGRDRDRRHIGKSSAGWCFSLHVEKPGGDGPHDLKDWLALFKTPGSVIKNESGDVVSVTEMVRTITRRSWGGRVGKADEWFRDNHAEPGPNGLARHAVNGWHCIGHGEGTWDYIVGEFS